MTQLLSLFGENSSSDDIGFLPVPGMATALAIRRMRRRKKQGKKFFGEELRGEYVDDFSGDLRGNDDIGFLPIPGMTAALAIRRARRRKKQGKKFFGEEMRENQNDIRGIDENEILGDRDIGFVGTAAATVGAGIFKGLKKFGKSKTGAKIAKKLKSSKIGAKTRKKNAAKKAGAKPKDSQFKSDLKAAFQSSDMTVVPKSEITATQDALQMLTTQTEKQSAMKALITPKNIAIGGGAIVASVILLKVLTHKKAVPVQVGLGTYKGCRR
jgi:hypothetical protein